MKVVTVIIPCFNHEKYITKTLKSIVNSTYKKIELILIDDGSTDKSFDIAKSYLEREEIKKRFVNIIIEKQENKGVTKTLNKMIDLSTGEYIVPLASDDYLCKDGITNRVKYLEENRNYFAVIGKCHLVENNQEISGESAGKKLYRADEELLVYDPKIELILRWSVVGPSILLRRNIFEIL